MNTHNNDEPGSTDVEATPPWTLPDLAYRPRDPQSYRPPIGLIGCGGVTRYHLRAYREAGYDVVALCDIDAERARAQQETFYPEADVYTDYADLMRRDDIEVVDIAPHPLHRAPIIEAALLARKHVLSQKPFVLDMDWGERMVDLADRQDVRLAVNQNGRWAPYFAYLRSAIGSGLLGTLASASLSVHWDHSWIINTPFEDIHDVVLYDYAIHWFDIVACFFRDRQPQRVYAATTHAAGQRPRPPLLGQVAIEYPDAQANLFFNAAVVYGEENRTHLAGTAGSAISTGPNLSEQTVTIYTPHGSASPALEGVWDRDGFHGTMAELLCAIEEGREPDNSARGNLASLELAFAAIASAQEGVPKVPGEVRRLPR